MASSGVTPFGFDFDNRDHLIVSEAMGGAADGSAVSSYDLRRGGFDVVSPSVPTTETAACWIAITPNGRYAYSGNAASMSITGYAIGGHGELTILTADGKTGSGTASVTDLATSSDGRFLYARMGDGTVGGWAIGHDGTLTPRRHVPRRPSGRRRHRRHLTDLRSAHRQPRRPAFTRCSPTELGSARRRSRLFVRHDGSPLAQQLVDRTLRRLATAAGVSALRRRRWHMRCATPVGWTWPCDAHCCPSSNRSSDTMTHGRRSLRPPTRRICPPPPRTRRALRHVLSFVQLPARACGAPSRAAAHDTLAW